MAELYRDFFESRLTGDTALLRHETLTAKKREGVATYAGLVGGESILVAVDSTIFGVATEGLAFTDRAVAWSFPDGNRGRIKYDSIPAHSVYLDTGAGNPQRLCFGVSPKHQVPCKSIRQSSAAVLADFLADAARVSQGLRPDEALPRARQLVAAGDTGKAVALWRALLDDDVLLFPAILQDVSKSLSDRSDDTTLIAIHSELTGRANDRESGWLLPRVGDRPEEVTTEILEKRWRSGSLRRDSRLRHIADDKWTTAGQVPSIQEWRTVYVSDTGPCDEEQLTACVQALQAGNLGYDELLVMGPTSARIDDAPGKPILHLGLTESELLLAWRPAGGPAVLERSPAIGVVWKVSDGHGLREIEIATAKRSVTFTLPAGDGTKHFIQVANDLFLRAAETSAAQDRRTEASRLLDRVVANSTNAQLMEQLRARVRAEEEVLCVYDGGHPDHVDPCLGTLRLDGDGFEFMSIAPESQVFFRVPYDRVIDFAAPQRGAMPADLTKSLFGPNTLVSAGLGVAAACFIPGGALLVRSLSSSMAADRSSGPPINRLSAVTSLSGTPYKIYFDVVGETTAEMSQRAKAFWSRTARMKSRFHKPGAAATAPRQGEAADPEVKILLREIRDSLNMVLRLLSLDLATGRRRGHGVLQPLQIDALLQSLQQQLIVRLGLPPAVATVPKSPEALIIACPKCGVRIRADRPGVIRCPSCETLARLGPHLFASRSPRAAVALGRQDTRRPGNPCDGLYTNVNSMEAEK